MAVAVFVLAACTDATLEDAADTPLATWLLVVLGVVGVVIVGLVVVKTRQRRTMLRGLYNQAVTDVDWLLDDAVMSAAVADREAHTRDVRKRSDRLHDTLSALASAGGAELAAGCVELRTRANDLSGTLVARLGDPTADHRDLDIQLGEKRERVRRAKEDLAQLMH